MENCSSIERLDTDRERACRSIRTTNSMAPLGSSVFYASVKVFHGWLSDLDGSNGIVKSGTHGKLIVLLIVGVYKLCPDISRTRGNRRKGKSVEIWMTLSSLLTVKFEPNCALTCTETF